MVDAKAAGVMFTLNPTNGDPSKIMIEANWGFGESVVSGSVTPDRWMIDKVTFEIIEKVVSTKLVEYSIDPKAGKSSLTDIPPERQNVPCLSEEEVLGIAKVGKEIERHFVIPQDIEWALDKGRSFPENMFILQARPAQLRDKKEIKPVLGTGRTSLDFILDIATQGKL
jgi:pyruvate,water dikinase